MTGLIIGFVKPLMARGFEGGKRKVFQKCSSFLVVAENSVTTKFRASMQQKQIGKIPHLFSHPIKVRRKW
jgi:hypothetical protein